MNKKDIANKMKHRAIKNLVKLSTKSEEETSRLAHRAFDKKTKLFHGRPVEELQKEAGIGKYKNRYN